MTTLELRLTIDVDGHHAGGGDEAVTMFAGCVVFGLGGLMMLINGIAPKLGLLIFLAGVVGSVMVGEVTMLGVAP